jgi:hypothetical protein
MSNLSTEQIETIAKQVYRQFPEIKDTKPVVQNQPGAKLPKAPGGGLTAEASRFLLTFKGKGQGPGGQAIVRIIRVVADERGKVIKISTSK